MGLNHSRTSSLTNTKYSLILSSKNNFYRNLTTIQGELHINIRKTLLIAKKIHIDLIGQLIDKNSHYHQIFFTYSYPLVTSHNNGIEKIIKSQEISYSFRIPLSQNLPPSCDLPEFSIVYHLDVFHDDRLLFNLRQQIILAPVIPHLFVPPSCQVTGSNDVTIICRLLKSFYSLNENSIIPLMISITNPNEKCIYLLKIKFIRIVSFNGLIFENEIFTRILNEIDENTRKIHIETISYLNLPSNLSPTNFLNQNGHADNIPSIGIKYEFHLIAQIEDLITPNLNLIIPIGIE